MYQIPIAYKKCATIRGRSGRCERSMVGTNPQFIFVDAMSDCYVAFALSCWRQKR